MCHSASGVTVTTATRACAHPTRDGPQPGLNPFAQLAAQLAADLDRASPSLSAQAQRQKRQSQPHDCTAAAACASPASPSYAFAFAGAYASYPVEGVAFPPQPAAGQVLAAGCPAAAPALGRASTHLPPAPRCRYPAHKPEPSARLGRLAGSFARGLRRGATQLAKLGARMDRALVKMEQAEGRRQQRKLGKQCHRMG
ncbi:hypothetical protein HYH03_010492 [Edaphochlamys debaryana]|uniref:Uncharacterized protein n=1 Tax=Edaphochlamys debaryana TaxID=47281 RepID=A0A835XZ20_9CHLO|nr:hypothetical protein HYH03_010492 [Edaphochlamys debaryana]|eukprot:KAG2491046.1 hypothetical protein HYH03_010492 [Edaphochlamys debaryana]